MNSSRRFAVAKTTICLVFVVCAGLMLTGCRQQESKTPQHTRSNAVPHDRDHKGDDGHHGESIELGTATIGDYTVRAARDQGDIRPGGDSPIDVWVTGDLSSIIAVRFWIGIQDGSGSITARGEIENPATPNHWHAHAEIPDPLLADSKLWVQLDFKGHGKMTASFDLHRQ